MSVGNGHLVRRAPRKNGGFSWARWVPEDCAGVTYRLFRRDRNGALHMHLLSYERSCSRDRIAREVHRARRVLRDKVDEIDLVLMEQEEAA